MKLYTIRYKEKDENKNRLVTKISTFSNLPGARKFGITKYREGLFVNLINKKGVVLPL